MDDIWTAEERWHLAVLLRQAAGATARDWVMTGPEGRLVIHLSGLIKLVEAAGSTLARWRELFAASRRHAAEVILRGARALHIATDWHGEAWLSDSAS